MNPAPRIFGYSVNPTLLLAVICLTGWMACVLWPKILTSLGLAAYGMTYLDSYAILAAVDVVRAGGDPYIVNPLDPLGRWHVYSDWWLALRWLGLGRADNFLVGSSWIAAFALSCWLAVKPRNLREVGWMAAVLLSPPVLLAFLRANNDLVIFVLIALVGVAAAGAGGLRQLLAVGALVLATGLKYYPALAAPAFLWTRPLRRRPVLVAVAVAAAGLTLFEVAPQMARAKFRIDSGVHTMGAPLLGRDLGWSEQASQGLSVVVLALGALALVRTRCTTGLASRGEPRELMLATLGTILLLACFMAGVNYAYRWIFIFWMALWVWRQAAPGMGTRRETRTAQVACVLLMFALWSDGALCVFFNRIMPLLPSQFAGFDAPWRLLTQPLHWALMMLFAGWLLEGVLATVREWWDARKAT
ncbi:hypothetical protein [Opitutus sp. GAS368]|uniref:hypothetical protein n=1 Tax=Opitutus sp. GAS368 TaxID=1882749 RepID=UPI00087DBF62|nr:hypothetical protein [Opitutus sp. GAS368]SDS09092.1 hypothetical protein SAMN05444173_1859 [Opitutus sp. GAS368]